MTENPILTFLWLELTGRCQLECVHCYADSSPVGTHGTMAVSDWKRVINEAGEMGVRTVQFIGGEPTLHPHLSELINHALSRAVAVEVFTNLVHVTNELWQTFAQPGVSLATSYYSDDPAQHAAITGRPSHARTRANIAKATELGIPLRVGVVDLSGDQHAEQARGELMSLGVPVIGYDRLRQVGRGVRDQGETAKQLCGQCGHGSAAVLPDGTLSPCVMSRWVSVGNVQQEPLREVVAGLPAARFGLTSQGMPATVGVTTAQGNCTPCGPQGNCYPIHCHPRA
ncbi:radical SAM protein [Amycolatopsis sp.]|uniref:radical SAM protein n=1 Tax=Amycolatopsis sp. TaxID=37632 RepID=UPI002B481150|nr:radical SAM protein [Amycolatopsis sp.]